MEAPAQPYFGIEMNRFELKGFQDSPQVYKLVLLFSSMMAFIRRSIFHIWKSASSPYITYNVRFGFVNDVLPRQILLGGEVVTHSPVYVETTTSLVQLMIHTLFRCF